MSDAPIPADLTLPRLRFIPLETSRLFASTLFAVATPAEFRAAFCLWCKSWEQTPPGSLPNNDRELCYLAELRGDLATWRKVKRIALRHWERHDDGRLYHHVITELVLETHNRFTKQRQRTAAATEARKSHRDVERNVDVTKSPSGLPLKPKPNKNPPYIPPAKAGGTLVDFNELKERGAEPVPIDPRKLGHAPPCHCPNCVRWEAQQRTA